METNYEFSQRIVSALENNFRDWLMAGEHEEAVKIVREMIDKREAAKLGVDMPVNVALSAN